MTIINCTVACVYEDDGKCTLNHVQATACTVDQDCGFFKEREGKENLESPSTQSKKT